MDWRIWAMLGGCCLAESGLGNILSPGPLLAPLAVAAAGVLRGRDTGAVFGMGTGLLLSLAGRGTGLIWALALAGYLSGTLGLLVSGFFGYLLCAGESVMLAELSCALGAVVFRGASPGAAVSIAVREGGITLLFAPLVYLLFCRANHREMGLTGR